MNALNILSREKSHKGETPQRDQLLKVMASCLVSWRTGSAKFPLEERKQVAADCWHSSGRPALCVIIEASYRQPQFLENFSMEESTSQSLADIKSTPELLLLLMERRLTHLSKPTGCTVPWSNYIISQQKTKQVFAHPNINRAFLKLGKIITHPKYFGFLSMGKTIKHFSNILFSCSPKDTMTWLCVMLQTSVTLQKKRESSVFSSVTA